MTALVGAKTSFDKGREQLDLLAGIEVTAKAVERHAEDTGTDIATPEQEIRAAKQLEQPAVCAPIAKIFYIEMDGTGLPVVKAETEGRAGKVAGQPAHTREPKLGCVFTQTTTDKGGPTGPRRGLYYLHRRHRNGSRFGRRLYTEAWRRGWSRARKKVVLGDGAIWIWNLADQHFPGAIQIVDLFHVRQHSGSCQPNCFPPTNEAANVGRRELSTGSTAAKS
jgi:hypothetical protein